MINQNIILKYLKENAGKRLLEITYDTKEYEFFREFTMYYLPSKEELKDLSLRRPDDLLYMLEYYSYDSGTPYDLLDYMCEITKGNLQYYALTPKYILENEELSFETKLHYFYGYPFDIIKDFAPTILNMITEQPKLFTSLTTYAATKIKYYLAGALQHYIPLEPYERDEYDLVAQFHVDLTKAPDYFIKDFEIIPTKEQVLFKILSGVYNISNCVDYEFHFRNKEYIIELHKQITSHTSNSFWGTVAAEQILSLLTYNKVPLSYYNHYLKFLIDEYQNSEEIITLENLNYYLMAIDATTPQADKEEFGRLLDSTMFEYNIKRVYHYYDYFPQTFKFISQQRKIFYYSPCHEETLKYYLGQFK